ncbi:HEPN domain-containing protein [Pseudoxanthomonas gei]|uniref:HEPN domain-containing protein n=1 Tax=Pseudoxanthomonas gei TaxID=1383030 RepID=UPI001391790C|nr:HEPN domain-containing protein [Pseudoxanthomonas gei]
MQYRKTKAHETHKLQVQQAFDFAVTVCHAMPLLQAHLQEVAAGTASLSAPHYFSPNNSPTALTASITTFEERLSSYLLLSLFSFYEAFVKAAIQEMFDFHGGAEVFIELAQRREKARVNTAPSQRVQAALDKMRVYKKGKEERYQKHSVVLEDEKYRFPTEILSFYGVRMLVDRHKNLKAHAIPDIIEHGLLIPLSDNEKREFNRIREQRNKIAHGKNSSLDLRAVSVANDHFREMTFRINTRLVQNFFVIERYAS